MDLNYDSRKEKFLWKKNKFIQHEIGLKRMRVKEIKQQQLHNWQKASFLLQKQLTQKTFVMPL